MNSPAHLSYEEIDYYFNYIECNLDYSATAGIGPYRLRKNLYVGLKNDITRNGLQAIAEDMCAFLGIFGPLPRITLSQEGHGKIHAGFYNGDIKQPEITIICNFEYSIQTYLAILAHEITHYYLGLRRIQFSDVHANEILTDLAGIYLGFGYILEIGYREAEKVEWMWYILFALTRTTKSSVGYISESTIRRALATATRRRQWALTDSRLATQSILPDVIPTDNSNEIKQGLIIGGAMLLFLIFIKIVTMYL